MQNLKVILILLSLCFMSGISDAQQNSSQNSSCILIKKGKPESHRPQMPSKQLIVCTYENGILALDFNLSEGLCTIQIHDIIGDHNEIDTFDSSELHYETVVEIGCDLEITLTTQNGSVYTGTIN